MGEIHFHPEALIEEAMESTELNDFGRLPVRPGLTALCETYERNVADPAGRRKCRDRLINLLTVRLRIERAFKTIPEVAEQEPTRSRRRWPTSMRGTWRPAPPTRTRPKSAA